MPTASRAKHEFCRRDIGAKALKYDVMKKRPGMLSTAEKEVHVIPEPAYLRWASKEYIDLADYRLADTPEAAPFADDLRRLFGLTGSGTGRLLCGKLAGAESPEAYTISARSGEVRIAAASRRGMRYAVETLKQLRAGTWLREMDLEDAPAMAVRGFHTNLTNMRQLDFPAVLKLIDTFAKFKINTWLLEYNHTFPFAGHPALHGALTFSPEEVAEIERRCQALDIEIMPLMQCLGHNGHIGIHPEYRHLFEPEDGGNAADMQFCPLNPDAFKLFQDLAGQIMAAHPGGKYFHIAADEARRLGKCPKCAAFVREHGAGRLYTDCINRACSWVREQGRVPVIWDDMLSHYPDLVPQIDRSAAIMYWDYWTTSDPTPFFIARPTAMPQTADAYWQNHFAELDEPERTITGVYGEFTDVAKLLETPNMQPIRKYLGPRTPRWFDAFPYFDFYRDLGFQVFAAPSALGNTIDDLYGLPNLGRTCKNIRLFAEKCRKSGGAGLFTTAWYDFPPEILLIGVIETAQNTWCGREMPPADDPQTII